MLLFWWETYNPVHSPYGIHCHHPVLCHRKGRWEPQMCIRHGAAAISLWYLNPVCHLAHATCLPMAAEKGLRILLYLDSHLCEPWFHRAQGPTFIFSTSVLHSSHTPAQSAQSYLLLTTFEPVANPQSSLFIPPFHPYGSSILALSLISFIVSVFSFCQAENQHPAAQT